MSIAHGAPAGSEVEWLIDGIWFKLAMLVCVAICVLLAGQAFLKRSGRRPGGGARRKLDFDLAVAKMASLPRTDIRDLCDGPCHLEGEIRSATEHLGGETHPIVYFNRAGEGRDAAVAAALVLVGDETGQVALVNLDQARVIAAPEEGTTHARICLRVGDRVEVVGDAVMEAPPARDAEMPQPGRVYATLGAQKSIQVRTITAASNPSGADPHDEPHPPKP